MEEIINILEIEENEYLNLKLSYNLNKQNKTLYYTNLQGKRYFFLINYLKYVLEYLDTKFETKIIKK